MDYTQLITGLLIAGESAVLYIVMRGRDSLWLNSVNRAYVVVDVFVGLLLLASGAGLIPVQSIILFTSTLIHAYRDYEAYKGLENRYAFNTPLLAVLNMRLLGLLFVLLKN